MKLPKQLTTVTPFSKYLAMILFILFPFLGFYFGIQYEKILLAPQQQIVGNSYISQMPTHKIMSNSYTITDSTIYKGWKTYTNSTLDFQFSYPPIHFTTYTDDTIESASLLRAAFSPFSSIGDTAYQNNVWLNLEVIKTTQDANTIAGNEVIGNKYYIALKKEPVSIGGILGYELSYDPLGPTRTAKNDAVPPTYEGLVKKGDYLYKISYSEAGTTYLTKGQFDQILSSFQFAN